MKIRTSFVSNSSSTSYLVLTTQENFNECLNQLDERKRILLTLAFQHLDVKKYNSLFGKNLVSYSYISGNYDTFDNIDFSETAEVYNIDVKDLDLDDSYIYDEVWEVIREFNKLLKQNKTEFFGYANDM